MNVDMTVLPKGTILYHGTSADDFDEACEDLRGPAWFSRQKSVAERFARRFAGASCRIVVFQVTEDVSLYEILHQRDMQELADEFDISLCGVEAMRESVEYSGIPGWVIPYNYSDGDDILIVNTDVVGYLRTEQLEKS